MRKFEFNELKRKYSTITEDIKRYDSGKRLIYSEYVLDDQLDRIHEEICDAANDLLYEVLAFEEV